GANASSGAIARQRLINMELKADQKAKEINESGKYKGTRRSH
ncbi:19013_t:CDS:2, partial [Funneliformis geosporum]